MRKYSVLAVVFFVNLLPGLLFAGDAVINGADKPVPVNSFAELSVTAKEGDKVSWTVYPPPVKKVDDGGGKLYFSGPPGCSYIVSVVVVNFESKRFDTGNTTVTTAEAAPDETAAAADSGCAPGTKPKPKPPTDQFQKKLQSAYDLEDPAEQKLVRALADNFQYSADSLVGSATTWAGLWQAMSADAKQRGVPGHLQIVQKVVAAELSKTLPTSVKEDQPLDAAGRQNAIAAFRRVSAALGRLK